MENENWKVYKETNSHGWYRVYEVSDQGNVKVNGELVDFSNQESYYRIGGFSVHRAVAELFIPNPNNYNEVDHINGRKNDNRVVNLRWCSHKENCNNNVTRKIMSEKAKEVQNRPEVKAKHHGVTKEAAKEAMNRPEVKVKTSAAMKDRCHMTNGINHVFIKMEKVNYYKEMGYHFGRK